MSRPRAILVAALILGLGIWALVRPVCTPIDLAHADFVPTPIEERTDRAWFGPVFQQRDGQWYGCGSWIARKLRF